MTLDLNERVYITRLLPRHFKILEMTLAGHQSTVIAEVLKMSAQAVRLVQKSPLFQSELIRRRKESQEETLMNLDRQSITGKARSILEEASAAAANVNVELLESEDDSIKLRAASSILDRVFGKNSDNSAGATVINVTADQIALLNIALRESNGVHAIQPANSPASTDPKVSEREVDVPEASEGRSGGDGSKQAEAQGVK